MAVLSIREYPESVLKKKTSPVTEFNDELQRIIDDMFDTMYAAPGLGLAAPQVGLPLRLFVYDVKESEDQPRQTGVLINPVLLLKSGSQTGEEGCLSVPEFRTRVTRADRVSVKGLDRSGKEVTLEGKGLMARLLQHEMDHLVGILYLDRVSSLKRQMILKRMRKRAKSASE